MIFNEAVVIERIDFTTREIDANDEWRLDVWSGQRKRIPPEETQRATVYANVIQQNHTNRITKTPLRVHCTYEEIRYFTIDQIGQFISHIHEQTGSIEQ